MNEKTDYNIQLVILQRKYFYEHGTIDGFVDPPKTWITWKQWWAYYGHIDKTKLT